MGDALGQQDESARFGLDDALPTGELHFSLQHIPGVISVPMDMGWGPSKLRRKRVLDQRIAPLRLLASRQERGPRGTDGDRLALLWCDHHDVLHS